MGKIALFGGSFDPVHLGHLALVVSFQERYGFDHIYIIPASQNPFKKQTEASAAQRLKMLEIAFKDLDYCHILPIELEQPGPSYTLDTIHELKRRGILQADDELYLLLGEDQLNELYRWKGIDEFMQSTLPLIAARDVVKNEKMPEKIWRWVQQGICDTPRYDISATDIRRRLQEKRYCGHLLDRNVLAFIQQHRLYE